MVKNDHRDENGNLKKSVILITEVDELTCINTHSTAGHVLIELALIVA